MINFASSILDFISMVGDGVKSFVDFIISLPQIIYDLIDILPNPIYTIVISVIGFLIFIIFMKVVRLIVG